MNKEWQDLVRSLPDMEWKEGENVFHRFEGYYFEPATTRNTLESLKTWEVRKNDTFVLSYPKAGNTWMLQILALLKNDGDVNKVDQNIAFRVPFLEMSPVKHCSQVDMVPSTPLLLDAMSSPRLIKTHLPREILPKQIFKIHPKIIYIARNPKDLAISYYHFSKYNLGMPDFDSFGTFLTEFCAARVYGGHYLNEAKFWWEQRNNPNILFLKYEDMKRDLTSVVVKIADFMNQPISEEVIQKIVMNSDFKTMKANRISNPDSANHSPPHKKGVSFMRKGQVGDWRNHFTVAQNEAFDEYYQTTMTGSTLSFDFDLQMRN